jgi:hypothetical protein
VRVYLWPRVFFQISSIVQVVRDHKIVQVASEFRVIASKGYMRLEKKKKETHTCDNIFHMKSHRRA